jgi:glycosyltransferase involved in cell wall biosynthesis
MTYPIKVLVLTRYTRRGASSRLRFYQFFSYLELHGIQLDMAPFFDEDYLSSVHSGRKPYLQDLVRAYFKRIYTLYHSRRCALVWLEYEAFPWLPVWFERLLGFWNIPYIVEYDDAIFHRYDLHPSRLVRFIFGRKIDRIMSASQRVIAGNDYLATRALQAGAKQVDILPTVVDTTRYQPIHNEHTDVVVIGWIGSPVTQRYLDIILGALSRLFELGKPFQFLVVGGRQIAHPSIPIVSIPWHESEEIRDIQSFDIGIMPLTDSPWERGKCGYKLIQYMACGKPVIASPVGANRNIVQHGINGFLAEDEDQWVDYLSRLIDDPSLRLRMGNNGRDRVVAEFSFEHAAPKLLSLIKAAANISTSAPPPDM